MSESVPITRELLTAGRSDKGGWSAAQLALLGVSWPPPKGWSQTVLGKQIPAADAELFIQSRGLSRSPVATPPAWLVNLRSVIPAAELPVVDHVWTKRTQFVSWPETSLLFMPGVVRGVVKFHKYTPDQREQFKQAKLRQDPRSNGPSVMAFRLAGGLRPMRSTGREGWAIHHIYDGQFPAEGRSETTRAVAHPDYFTQAAGLVAVHPIADALADEVSYFAWLLRFEAFVRFGFDPDGVFRNPAEVGG